MPASSPTIYIIAGCNGAGKTTFATEFLPHEVHCLHFLNPDEIARGISPLDPAAGAIKAGRILLQEIQEAIRKRQTFAIESTLSGRTYVRMLRRAREAGYEIELHYLWLASPAEALERIRQRVRNGGHNVPVADVRRRFRRSLKLLLSDYLTLATRWVVWDNRRLPPREIANSATHDVRQMHAILGT